jgi:hypothetical protein
MDFHGDGNGLSETGYLGNFKEESYGDRKEKNKEKECCQKSAYLGKGCCSSCDQAPLRWKAHVSEGHEALHQDGKASSRRDAYQGQGGLWSQVKGSSQTKDRAKEEGYRPKASTENGCKAEHAEASNGIAGENLRVPSSVSALRRRRRKYALSKLAQALVSCEEEASGPGSKVAAQGFQNSRHEVRIEQ